MNNPLELTKSNTSVDNIVCFSSRVDLFLTNGDARKEGFLPPGRHFKQSHSLPRNRRELVNEEDSQKEAVDCREIDAGVPLEVDSG